MRLHGLTSHPFRSAAHGSEPETAAPVYLDHQATTPLDPRVRSAMLPFLTEDFGNPHSIGHIYGWRAAGAVRHARAQVADFINADDDEVVFTSGATEACNLAIRGTATATATDSASASLQLPEFGLRRPLASGHMGSADRGMGSARRRIVTLATEHPAVLETVVDLGSAGWDAIILPVATDGLIDLDRLDHALQTPTLLVSVMAANNEIGVVQPLAEVAARCRRAGALLHTDATQAAGRISMDVDEWGVDLMSISAHKVYGPKGVGALFVRAGTPVAPILTGGGQEKALRPGTIPVPLVAGFGAACEIALREAEEDGRRMAALAEQFVAALKDCGISVQLFGHPTRRIPGSLSLGLSGVSADTVVREAAPAVAISTGSACASATSTPSHVLVALGHAPEVADTAVRVSVGRFTTEADIATAAGVIAPIVQEWALDGIY